ncbi:MAG: FAD-dependent oxidoreductase [Gaiellaceae bacterium]
MTTSAAELTHIWQPLDIGPVQVEHRVMATGHTQLYGEDELITDRHVAYYRERAMGGASLLILEQQAAHPSGMNYEQGCVAWEPRVVPEYAKLAEAVHPFGTKQMVQLFCCGAQGLSTMFIDRFRPLWAASPIPSSVYNERPKSMEKEDIAELVDYFGRSAFNVMTAGLDGVEIHAAHSQLLGEFLSPAFNKRTDEYGGSVENMCRIVTEVGEEIRRRVGDRIAVGVRLSADEFLGETGICGDDFEAQVEVLASTGLFDFFDISGGGYHTLHVAVAPMNAQPEGFLAPYAERAKEIVGHRAKIFVVGRILNLEKAEEIVSGGQADMVAMTRAQIADPHHIRKRREQRDDEITHCAGINFCIERLVDSREVTCALNPTAGRERRWGEGTLELVPEGSEKKIAFVGAGPAGMQAAALAAKRGHSVTIFERASEAGGNFNLIKQLPTRSGWQIAIDNLTRPLEGLGIDLRLEEEASAQTLESGGWDAVVTATGASWSGAGYSPYRPEREGIPGAEQDNVIDVGTAIRRAVDDPSGLGSRVLILDETAGYLPLGLAELLADGGVSEIEVVTPQLLVGELTMKSLDMIYLFPRLVGKGITLTSQHFVEKIEGDTVELYDVWGGPRRDVTVDTLVLAQFKDPNDALWQSIRHNGFKEVHRIGDCVAPRKPAAVIYEGEQLGREI